MRFSDSGSGANDEYVFMPYSPVSRTYAFASLHFWCRTRSVILLYFEFAVAAAAAVVAYQPLGYACIVLCSVRFGSLIL